MNFAEYVSCDATALAEHVARGDTTPAQLLELALAQHRRVHGQVNAVVRLMDEQARAQLQRPVMAPFAGVPFLIKDNGQDYAGLPTTNASRSMQTLAAAEHASVVRRYLESGLVIFGKTNLPEFALKAVSDAELFGRTNNPWNLEHTPAVRAAAPRRRSRPASSRWPLVTTAAARSGFRRPAAACSACALRAAGYPRGRPPAKSGSARRARA